MSDWRKINPTERKSYLASLPEEIYDLSDTSHLVRLMDALCGDSGVGYARKSLFLKRLQTALSETRFNALDMVYSYMFGFPRLKCEEYDYSTSSLLTWDQQEEIQVKDSHYRARILKYMRSFQYGGTKKGIQLAAEAAIACPCQVVQGHEYYKARGIENGEAVTVKFGDSLIADYNEYLIVVMRDDSLTQEEYRSLSNVTKRIRPVDAKVTFKTVNEVSNDVLMRDLSDIYYQPELIEESSHWWNIVKRVTGRPDWDYIKYPSLWIEPNVEKEAPRQLLVNSQEEQEDFTFMIKSSKASTEHIGHYNRTQAQFFESLSETTELMPAAYSISTASSRKYTASFYGGDSVIGWSYPIEYSAELQSYFTEEARSVRFWSSDEVESGTEWLEYELKRTLPLSRIQLNISRKPMRVIPYASSALDADGNRIWVRLQDENGLDLAYSQRNWGGSSLAGEMITVDFSFDTIQADAVKIEFERIDVPYRKLVGANAYEEMRFPYSIEASNLSLYYEVKKESDFIASTYEDPFGNKVVTSLRDMTASKMFDGEDLTYWVSQPNIGEDAVEFFTVKVGDSPVRVNLLEISSIYDGCQMNLYSTDESKPGNWKPYPEIYTLAGGRLEIPTRKVTYLKFEFTNLCAIPYKVAMDGIEVDTREYPYEVKTHIESVDNATRELSAAQRLLTSADDASYEVSNVYTELGIQDIYQQIESSKETVSDDNWGRDGFNLFSSYDYRANQGASASISGVYGEDFQIEQSLEQSRATTAAVDEKRVRYRFYEEGEHEYSVRKYERSYDLAYVVGIKEIKIGFSAHSVAIDTDATFVMPVADGRFISDIDHWELVDDERMYPTEEDIICSFETIDLETAVPFRSFEFAVNEKEPREMFDSPSNMLMEWGGYNSDVYADEFGASGTVLGSELSRLSDSGIESESKLVRSKSIANVQVDVFPLEDSEWVFECNDAYDENIFSMHYSLEKGKWTTVGTVFNPMPGGGWWSLEYKYRVTVNIQGPIAEGNSIFVPSVDFDALTSAGITTSDFKDIRLIYFDGVENHELNCDITDNMELWFKCQQTLSSGEESDGKYHFDSQEFHGAYHIYFGNKSETLSPKRDYKVIFDQHSISAYKATRSASGATFSGSQYIEIDDGYRLSSREGFLTLEYNPTSTPAVVPEGTEGQAEVRYLLDYIDEDKGIQIYTYERQLTFVILEKDGFENAFVSAKYDMFVGDTNRRLMVTWGDRGSKEIRKDDTLSDSMLRRDIHVYISTSDGYEELECIPNVYDEKRYNKGSY